jgi:predicted ester cyclase
MELPEERKKAEKPMQDVPDDKKNAAGVYRGESSQVTPVGRLDYNDFSRQAKRSQDMNGFAGQYRDFVDYIMKITHDIWENRGIGVIYDTYHNNVVMHAGSQNIVGIREVISGTLQTLHAFPDRRLIGQNVIWSPIEGGGFLSSHRVISTATNLGDSSFAPATGRAVNFRTTIDCAVANNRVYEEWLVRDNLWLVAQLGLDAEKVAQKMAGAAVEPACQASYGLCEAMDGQFMPTAHKAGNDSVGEMMLEMASRIYHCKRIDEVKRYYHPHATTHFVCNRDLNGYDEIQGMLVSLLASIPNGSYEVERVTYNERAAKDEYDVALRWRLRGLNEGIGFFGAPSRKPLEVLGISHFHVRDNRVAEEWITFDGLDVLRQKYIGNSAQKCETTETEEA